LLRQRNVPKRKATLHAASLRSAAGNLRCSCMGRAAELATRCALRSNNRSESDDEGVCPSAHARPTPCAPRRILKGTRSQTATRAIAALGPTRRRIALRSRAERSDGPCGCSVVHPIWLRLRRGSCGVSMRVEARMPRQLTRRGCPSGARSAKRVPRRTPQAPRRRFAPQGSQTVGRLSLAYFSLAKQRKVSRPPGRDPAPALNKDTASGTTATNY
jgi:hypothetical protein